LDSSHRRNSGSGQRLVGDQNQFYASALGNPIKDVFNDGWTGVCIHVNFQSTGLKIKVGRLYRLILTAFQVGSWGYV
jgi:hypothetical protein